MTTHGKLARRKLRLEESHRERSFALNEEQFRRLERFSPEFRKRQIEVHYSGKRVAVSTFFVGTRKDVGKIYLQSVLDGYSRFAYGRPPASLPSSRSMSSTRTCSPSLNPTGRGS